MDAQAQHGLFDTYRVAWRNRGAVAWLLSAALICFYSVLYWTEWLAPAASALGLSSKWGLYGLLYSVAVCWGAVWSWRRHGSSRYQRVRIGVNAAVQVVLGFSVPLLMPVFGQPEYYFSYFWPLKLDALYPHTLQSLPTYLAVWSVLGAFVIAPSAALLWGKRWYCSWVCGCGALANTFGDPWRHLSDRSERAWRFEKVSVHLLLGLALVTTGIVMTGQLNGFRDPAWQGVAGTVQGWWGFAVGAVLAGVVGTGLYPILGPRVWCRYFCPMAALLGLTQRAGRFRIRVQPDLCIACGNCSTYCEMGIDVRAYAMANTTFTRASCVGCGMCAHVCPRSVLKLEASWPLAAEAHGRGRRVVDL
jgi:polyferredoxin